MAEADDPQAQPEPLPLSDKGVLRNLNEARANGYDLACVLCGAGIADDSDMHDPLCPEWDEERWQVEMRATRQ